MHVLFKETYATATCILTKKKKKHNNTWFLLMYIETVLSKYLLANALLGHAHN